MAWKYSFFLLPGIIWYLTGPFNSRGLTGKNHETDIREVFSDDREKIYAMLDEPDLNHEAMKYAFIGYGIISDKFEDVSDQLITIIDYSLPSTVRRLFVIDLLKKKVVYKTFVSHGKNSGQNLAESFSNQRQSHKSCLGFFITGNTYYGHHGYSLRLLGIEDEINDNAWERGIVMHAANYVSEDYIQRNGRLGRSFGCPAIPVDEHQFLIDLIKNRTCLFVYYPDKNYLADSKYLITRRSEYAGTVQLNND